MAAVETTGETGTTGMWASTKHDSDLTAQESLQAVLDGATAKPLNEDAEVRAKGMLLFGKLQSTQRFIALVSRSSLTALKAWLWSFTKAGRAARIEHEWEEAVKRAHAAHAFRERMESLQAARQRRDEETRSAESSALGHRQRVRPRTTTQSVPITPAGPAGSIWSRDRVASPAPIERSASEIVTPGLRRLTPTPSRPASIYESHSIFRDSTNVTTTDANGWDLRANLSEHDRYFESPQPASPPTADEFNEIITSYSDSISDYPPMKSSPASIDKVDELMHGDNDDTVLFGRWRHHKDAPLSFVKEMVERELRGPGACSLYGPGGLPVEDHPLVRYYNERLEKEQAEEQELSVTAAPQLSPVLMQGRNASQRSFLRETTPVTFEIGHGGTFKATGFHQRTGSIGSTVESMSLGDHADSGDDGALSDSRRDSAINIVESPTDSLNKPTKSSKARAGNYDVLRLYSPDPALNMKKMNDEEYAPDHEKPEPGWVTATYVKEHCDREVPPAQGLEPRRTAEEIARAVAYHRQQRDQALRRQHQERLRRIHRERELRLEYEQQQMELSQQRKEIDAEIAGVQDVQPVPDAQDQQIQQTNPQNQSVQVQRPKRVSFSEEMLESAEPSSGNKSNLTVRPILKKTGSSSSSAASVEATITAGLDTSADATPSHNTPGTTASSGSDRKASHLALAHSMARELAERLQQTGEDDFDCPGVYDLTDQDKLLV